jgi:methyltransferase family protein
VTSVDGRDSRLRRTVRSVPVVGTVLRAGLTAYHRRQATAVRGYTDLKDQRLPAARNLTAVAAGASLSAGARKLLLLPYRSERVNLPLPLDVEGHCFDVVQDLVEFTALPPEHVRDLIARRPENFRTEWLQWPPELRDDRWFYLSSRMYLFANAPHFYEAPEVIDEVAGLLPGGARVLDFGGGTGNLSLALAARGFVVHYHELSALQKDFARFRTQRHGLRDRVEILDSWEELPPAHYDAICAFDVFEHLPDLPKVVDPPSFSIGLANPMHHEDPGLTSLLTAQGFVLERTRPAFRVWTKRVE